MVKRFSIFGPSVGAGLGKNVFGKDVANHSLFRSFFLYGGLEQLDILNPNVVKPEQIVASFIGNQTAQTKIRSYPLLDVSAAKASGTLMRGTADIINLAWDRRAQGTAFDYSLIGLIHTIAPHSIREYIAQTLVAPVMPWDALICTSPSIQTAMRNMFEEWRDYLGARFSGEAASAPLLPLIPLGIEASDFPSATENQQGRASLRAELGVGSEELLVLWVGRLSFFEKAFPQPMMLALESAAKLSGKRVHFAMAGWFPNKDTEEKMYRHAASVHAPTIAFHIIDGNDKPKLRNAWAGADVFISLVDNIQETFGITPLEAMASGLPVVVSDWDGYRYTVRDEIEGFLIPTAIGAPNKTTAALSRQHMFGTKTYQQYVGVTAQHSAVHVGIAAKRLTELFASKELRLKMGEAGRQRVLSTFDWRIVIPHYIGLANELRAIREVAAPSKRKTSDALITGPAHHPSRSDPFHAFANFPTHILAEDSKISLAIENYGQALNEASGVVLSMFGSNWRATISEMTTLCSLLQQNQVLSLRELALSFPSDRQGNVRMSVLWLAKMGVIDWI